MALQRPVRRLFALVAASGLLGLAMVAPAATHAQPTPAARGADLFDEIFRRGAPMERTLQTVSASFVETTSSTLLKTPQVARGTLIARRPGQVRLDYTGPDRRTVIVNGNTLALDWPSRRMRDVRDIGGTMRRASRFFQVDSPADLRKHFDIEAVVAVDRTDTWQVTFKPRRAQMREGVSLVHLWIDQSSLMLRAMRMDYPGGDTRLMEFADVRVNPPVEPSAFAVPTGAR